jgi:translocation and assembly module TamB
MGRRLFWAVLAWQCAILAPQRSDAQTRAAAPHSAEATTNVRYFNRQWSFDDVDIGKLTRRLGRIGLEIPVALEGRVSGTISVGVPWNALRNARAWRLGGSLTSPRLVVNDFAITALTVRLNYRDGSLFLDQFTLNVPPPGEAAAARGGGVNGSARMQLVPPGELTASLEVDKLPLTAALRSLATLQPVGGDFSGNVSARVAVDRLRDVSAWAVRGAASLADVTFRDLPSSRAEMPFELNQGVLRARQFELAIGRVSLNSDIQVSLLGDRPWSL